MKHTLGADMYGLPQMEPYMVLTQVNQRQFDDYLKPTRNILIIDINKDKYTQVKVHRGRNQWSQPQAIYRIQAPDDESWVAFWLAHGEQVREWFIREELSRQAYFYRASTNKTARAAINAGADCLLMDDGFQNPGLHKTFSLLIIDGTTGLGNGRVLPAGPLREKANTAIRRASALLLVDEDLTGFISYITQQKKHILPIYRGYWQQTQEVSSLIGKTCIAFAGLGRPEKFFSGLQKAGVFLQQTISYPDHYYYKKRDIDFLITLAHEYNSLLVTTPKDAVRLPYFFRQQIKEIGVTLHWHNPTIPEHILDTLLGVQV